MDAREALAGLVNELVEGWHERVEYKVLVKGHLEARAASVRQDAILVQLLAESSGWAPVSMGARWGKPGSRPPATLDLIDLVHHIDHWLIEVGATGRSRVLKLRSLVTTAGFEGDNWTRETCRDLRRFIKTARIMLGYDAPPATLRDTVCGQCGGTLSVASDAQSDVRCIGTREAASCGTTYPQWQWVDLIDG